MELRHLRYFVAVAEEQHVTRAALRLGIQQPPLSQQLRALEREVGADLFERLPRGMALTAAGEEFLSGARAALEASERCLYRARLAASGQVGRVAIGMTTSASLHPAIPDVIGRFHRDHPAITLDVLEANASDLTEALARGEVDVVFLRAVVSRPLGLVFDELLREQFAVVVPHHHRLSGQRISLGDLQDERFILVRRPAAPGMYGQLLDHCRAIGFEPVVALEVERMLTAVSLVAAGLGVTLVPASMTKLRAFKVIFTALTSPETLRAPLTLVHRQGETRPAVTGLLQSVRESIAGRSVSPPRRRPRRHPV